ncbi:hypothetical protein [Micropruina sp.]|uniref:hypothetical protein n=1 Tax=Micropruina sp. TaxID=2737536 RepID=UPI002608D7EB|nr:hypothetical protein [Micropruina sp.]
MSTTTTVRTRPTWTTANRVGLALTLILGLGNVTSAFFPTPDGEVGPPFEVLLADTVLAVVVVVSVVVAWVRGSRLAARIAAGCVILVAISAMPAFFVDVAPGVKALAGAITLVTVLACGLMLAPAKRKG